MKTRNPRPDRCEICGGVLPVDKQARPRSIQVLFWSEHHTPLGLCACGYCHGSWMDGVVLEVGAGPAGQMALPLNA